jgi:hypothetical protein
LNPAATASPSARGWRGFNRLVHHSIILEFDGVSQRVKKAASDGAGKTDKSAVE